MFILRQITTQGISNMIIGKRYSIIRRDDIEKKEKFKELLGKANTHPDQEQVYGFIIYDEGKEIWPLYKKQSYYIMTGDGVTFERVRYKIH